jgi:murein DD-endopeptidase MepM/ murein hydrolase activator NlpD
MRMKPLSPICCRKSVDSFWVLIIISILILLFLAGCQSLPDTDTALSISIKPSETQVVFSATPTQHSSTPSPTANVAATASPTPSFQLCSPLEDIPIEQLNDMVSNPYHPPVPGSDDPHMGLDLADRLPGSQMAVSGRGVNAVLAGTVSVVNPERFPYGQAVLVETRLEDLPAGWLEALALPAPDPSPPPIISLTCPAGTDPGWDATVRSLYLLYAHLEETASLQPGDPVVCGQRLGTVGMSGNALNPHLHLEVRVGPAGLRFDSMAHYDASATLEEMGAYCAWRVGGQFQLVDPSKLFILNP